MKIGDYITSEDWNALGRDKQLALRDGLRFMGYRVSDAWFPIHRVSGNTLVVGLYDDGDLAIAHTYSVSNRISLEEVLSFIELTAFKVEE